MVRSLFLTRGEIAVALNERQQAQLLVYQRNEITEHRIYRLLAGSVKSSANRKILSHIAEDELRHAQVWKKYTGVDVQASSLNVWWFYVISRVFGLTFGVRLMERAEERAQEAYEQLCGDIPEIDSIIAEELNHEAELIGLLDERHLQYVGSIVLGLNDALVELTGALAGLTFALRHTRLIALTGMITGIAAALSMAASEYLSTRAGQSDHAPLRAAAYTGAAYTLTVGALIAPYLILPHYALCLGVTLLTAVLIIAAFTYYIAVVRKEAFSHRFLEMAGVSIGVAGLSFALGLAVRAWLGVEV